MAKGGGIGRERLKDKVVGGYELDDVSVTNTKIADGSVTTIKVKYAVIGVTVAAAATSGSAADDSTLIDGVILGIYPTGNQDQLIDNVTLSANGGVTVTLAAAATAANTFNVVILKA